MKVRLERSAHGMVLRREADSDDLPDALARRLEEALAAGALAAAEAAPESPHRTDPERYQLTLVGTVTERFDFSDAQCAPDLLDLLDALWEGMER